MTVNSINITAVLETVIDSLKRRGDTTACELEHEGSRAGQCVQHISDVRLGCPHAALDLTKSDILTSATRALKNIGVITQQSFAKHSARMAKLFDELGRMDDTAAGFILYYDYDEIPKEQARVIHQRDLYRRRIICMAERALNNIVT